MVSFTRRGLRSVTQESPLTVGVMAAVEVGDKKK